MLRFFATLLMSAVASQAGLILVDPVTLHGTGLGAVNTILTMDSPGKSDMSEGCVGWNGSVDVLGSGACSGSFGGSPLTGGNEKRGRAQTKTAELGSAGVTSLVGMRIVYNSQEPANAGKRSVTLRNVVLQLYAGNGALLFRSSDSAVYEFATTNPGTGNAGFHFALDSADLAAALAATSGYAISGLRAGLSAMAAQETGGPETFFLASVLQSAPPSDDDSFGLRDSNVGSNVPEPGGLLLVVTGLAAVAAISRRK